MNRATRKKLKFYLGVVLLIVLLTAGFSLEWHCQNQAAAI